MLNPTATGIIAAKAAEKVLLKPKSERKLEPLMEKSRLAPRWTAAQMDRFNRQLRAYGRRLGVNGRLEVARSGIQRASSYLRYRPLEYMARDAVTAVRERPWIPVAACTVAGGLLALGLLRRRK